jgi:hypothetical protein
MSFFTSSKEPLLGSASSASSASPGDSVIPFLEIDTPEFQAAVINGVNELKRHMGVDTIDDMDFNFILKYLKRYNEISDIFKRRRDDIPDEYINGLILSILDQINFYRNGCAIIQLQPLENKVSKLSEELNPPTRVEDVPLSTMDKFTKNVKDVAKKTSPKYWSKKEEYEKYMNELTELQKLHAQLSKESFATKNFFYSQRISNVIQKLRTKYGSVDGIFCGEATLSMGTEVFQLNIITSRNGGDDLKLSFTSQEVSLEDEVNIMNELVNYISEGEAEAPLLRSNNVRITNLMPKPSGCLQCGKCIMLGGAKKIKRTKQSKKRNVRLLKSKSKKTRRKNKMRRSQNNKK